MIYFAHLDVFHKKIIIDVVNELIGGLHVLLKSFFESDCSSFVHDSILKIKLKLLSTHIIFYLLKICFREAMITLLLFYLLHFVPTFVVGPLPFHLLPHGYNFWFIGL